MFALSPILHELATSRRHYHMENSPLVSAHDKRIAALGGFLEGISYLNRDSRADFASAFVVDAGDDERVQIQIQSIFSHLPGLIVKLGRSF